MHNSVKVPNKIYDIFVSIGMAGKYKSLDEFEEYELKSVEHPRFGRYWWFWKPRFKSNGGKFNRTDIVDLNSNFLCFWFSVTFFPRKRV